MCLWWCPSFAFILMCFLGFEDKDENKFEYTDIHIKYKALVNPFANFKCILQNPTQLCSGH